MSATNQTVANTNVAEKKVFTETDCIAQIKNAINTYLCNVNFASADLEVKGLIINQVKNIAAAFQTEFGIFKQKISEFEKVFQTEEQELVAKLARAHKAITVGERKPNASKSWADITEQDEKENSKMEVTKKQSNIAKVPKQLNSLEPKKITMRVGDFEAQCYMINSESQANLDFYRGRLCYHEGFKVFLISVNDVIFECNPESLVLYNKPGYKTKIHNKFPEIKDEATAKKSSFLIPSRYVPGFTGTHDAPNISTATIGYKPATIEGSTDSHVLRIGNIATLAADNSKADLYAKINYQNILGYFVGLAAFSKYIGTERTIRQEVSNPSNY